MRKMSFALAFILTFLAFACLGSGCKQYSNRTSYEINCTLDGYILNGEQTVKFFNDTENTFSELKFNLHANAFRKDAKYSPIGAQYTSRAYPNGFSYGGITINNTAVENQSADFRVEGVDQNILTIPLSSFMEDENDNMFVYVIEHGELKKIGITAGINSDDKLEVLSGLEEGMTIVSEINSTYKEGMRVETRK